MSAKPPAAEGRAAADGRAVVADDELGDVIEHAARLQHAADGRRNAETELDAVKAIAREVAIEPAFVDAALAERAEAKAEAARVRDGRRALAVVAGAGLAALLALYALVAWAFRPTPSAAPASPAVAAAPGPVAPDPVAAGPAAPGPAVAPDPSAAAERADLLARIAKLEAEATTAGCAAAWNGAGTCYVSNRLMSRAQFDGELARMRARAAELARAAAAR